MFENSLIPLLHRANQIANDLFDRQFTSDNVTARQVQLLVAIMNHEGCSQTDLVARTGVDRSTVADLMKRLLAKRYVERRRVRNDARTYMVKVTESGRDLAIEGSRVMADVEEQLLSSLPNGDGPHLLRHLSVLIEGSNKGRQWSPPFEEIPRQD